MNPSPLFNLLYVFWMVNTIVKIIYIAHYENIGMATYPVTLLDIVSQTPSVKLFHFSYPLEFTYESGQFATLEFPDETDEIGKPLKRIFSIASSPLQKDRLEFCIKIEGAFTKRLETLGLGGVLRLHGPGGKFLMPSEMNEAIFIAMGTGIAPLMSMMRTLWQQKFDKPMRLLYGIREEKDFIFREELIHQLKRNKSFDMHVALSSQQRANFPCHKGRITKDFLKKYGLNAKADYFVCGNPDFVKAMAECLTELGVPAEKFHREQW